MKKFLGKLPIPAWLFAVVTVVYCEALLHLWTMESFRLGRFAAVVLFAVGFGGLIGQVFTFLGQKTWGKWVCAGVMALVTVLYIVEYFCNDAYMAFMQLGMLLGGAGGVATDFAGVVVSLVVRGLWRILLFFLPVIGYGLFAAPRETGWRLRWLALVAALVAYCLGFAVAKSGTDASRLSADDLAPLLALQPELIVLGTGGAQAFPPPEAQAACLSLGIGLEAMTNAAAARTYNVLAGEGRRVVAGFVLAALP